MVLQVWQDHGIKEDSRNRYRFKAYVVWLTQSSKSKFEMMHKDVAQSDLRRLSRHPASD